MRATLTIDIDGNNTSVIVKSSSGDPEGLLRRAMKALTDELQDLDNCPVHKKLNMSQGEWY